MKVLGEYVKHHVQEEENEIFPAVAGMEDDLDELGQEMHARKAELMAELGLETEAEEEMEEEGEQTPQRRSRAGRGGEAPGERRAR